MFPSILNIGSSTSPSTKSILPLVTLASGPRLKIRFLEVDYFREDCFVSAKLVMMMP